MLCAEKLGTIIRNNKGIKTRKIGDTEYKMSQYVDDTSWFTNGSPETSDGILRELDLFADISRLNINFSKTKMVWIGSKIFFKKSSLSLKMETWSEQYILWLARDKILGKLRWYDKLKITI